MSWAIDFNSIRKAIANEIQRVSGITAILEENEAPNQPRPELPYFSFKLTTPARKSGDDSKQLIYDGATPTTKWNSGGIREMTVSFNCYGTSHEQAYNYMALWQAALDLEDVQEKLRISGIAVWVIGNLADLSKLLNTAYEGRAQMDCTFGIASNISSDLGAMETVNIEGQVTTDQNTVVNTTQTIEED